MKSILRQTVTKSCADCRIYAVLIFIGYVATRSRMLLFKTFGLRL